jgi:hypothetical protein
MAMKQKGAPSKEISVLRITQSRIEFCILGKTPLILHRLSEKAKRELLMPKKKTTADKASSLKHNPYDEYRSSAYRSKDPKSKTSLLLPSNAFQRALCSAAVDIPGSAAKAQIGRLVQVEGDCVGYVGIYGVPKLHMAVTRNSDMARTPDIRTRAIVPAWACRIAVLYVTPVLREQAVANLLAAAGMIQGVGDWRPEKGRGNYGQFDLVEESNPDYRAIVDSGGRDVQEAAFENPECYDSETAELLEWFTEQSQERGFKVAV